MTSVFIGGSRRLGRMNAELTRRLDNLISEQLRVLIGDANGFDRAAQEYLSERKYRSVVVYCTAGKCRNNVGNWPVLAVDYQGKGSGLAFYTAKDDAMLRDANYGLFAWDAKSKGTLRNIVKMAELGKPSVVYVSKIKKIVTIRSEADALALSQGTPTIACTSQDLFSDITAATHAVHPQTEWSELEASSHGSDRRLADPGGLVPERKGHVATTTPAGDQLLAAVAELRSLFPDWRVGQLVASLTQAAGRDSDGAIWEVEDSELLAAARRLIDRNRPHRRPIFEPDRDSVLSHPGPTATESPLQMS